MDCDPHWMPNNPGSPGTYARVHPRRVGYDEHQEANSSNSICENETDNIGKDRVSKLKGMYEDTTSNIKEHNNNNLVQSNFRKTVSMSNLGSGHSQVWSSRFSQELKMGTTWCMPKTE